MSRLRALAIGAKARDKDLIKDNAPFFHCRKAIRHSTTLQQLTLLLSLRYRTLFHSIFLLAAC